MSDTSFTQFQLRPCPNNEVLVNALALRPFNPLRGVLGLFGPNFGNGVEIYFPLRGPKSQNQSRERVKKVERELTFLHFDSFFDSDFNFLGPGAGTHFRLCFQILARRAQELLWGD